MKAVDQTEFGMPRGNCLMACVASICEVPLESLPVLDDEIKARGGEEGKWWDVLQDALRQQGFTAIYYPNASNGDGDGGYYPIKPPGYHIASGMTDRGFRHAVVYLDGELAHDPHPSRAGLICAERFYLILPLAVSPKSSGLSGADQ